MRPRDVGIDLDKIEGMSGKGSWEGVAGLVGTKETTSRGSRGLNSFLPMFVSSWHNSQVSFS
jgi:hypothetical protein